MGASGPHGEQAPLRPDMTCRHDPPTRQRLPHSCSDVTSEKTVFHAQAIPGGALLLIHVDSVSCYLSESRIRVRPLVLKTGDLNAPQRVARALQEAAGSTELSCYLVNQARAWVSLIPCRKGASRDNPALCSALKLQPLTHLSLTAHPAHPGATAQEGALLTLQAAPGHRPPTPWPTVDQVS